MNDYEKSKVNMEKITKEHIRLMVQTIVDIKAEHIAPNVKVQVKIEEK